MKAEDLLNALATLNADPFIIETDEDAESFFNEVNEYDEIILTPEDGEEFEFACKQLDCEPSKTREIHRDRGDTYMYCLSKDFDY